MTASLAASSPAIGRAREMEIGSPEERKGDSKP
jgi:hypothetical protein